MSDSEELAKLVVGEVPSVEIKKKRRRRQRTNIPRQIQAQMRSTHTAIPRAAITRVIRELIAQHNSGMHLEKEAITILQAAAEEYVTSIFKKSQDQLVIAKKKTITANYFAYNAGAAPVDHNGTGWMQKRKKVAKPVRIFRSVVTLSS